MNMTARVLKYVEDHPGCTSSEVLRALGRSAQARCSVLAVASRPRLRRVKELGEDGYLRWRYWRVTPEPKSTPEPTFFVRRLMKAIIE